MENQLDCFMILLARHLADVSCFIVKPLGTWNRLRTNGANGVKFGMLMYPDHFQNWLDFVHGVLIFVLLVPFWLSEIDQIGVSGHLLENWWEEWPTICHADLSWPPTQLIWLWVNPLWFSSFWCHFDWRVNGRNDGVISQAWNPYLFSNQKGLCWGGSGLIRGIFPTICVKFSLFFPKDLSSSLLE